MRTQNKNNKILKFSIRKLSFGAAPVVIGALFFGSHVPSEALANENNPSVKYTYLAENELTESEKNLIKRSIPNNVKNNETYYMVYKKESQTSTKPMTELKELPNTGQSSLPVTGLGIGTAVLVVLLMSKKHRNKVLSVVLIGAMGQSIVMPYESFAFENKELVRYNTQTTVANSSELANGVINIDGYRYVGYFTLSDLGVLPQEEQKVLPKPTEPTQPVQPTVEPTQPEQPTTKFEYKTTPEEDVKTVIVNKPELKSTTEVVPFKTITQNDATLPKGQTKVVQEGVNGQQIVFSEVTTVDGKESSKVVKTSITKQPINKVIAVGTKEDVSPTPKVEYKTTPEEGVLSATVEKPELVVSTEAVAFKTIEQADATLPKGQTKVVQEGVNGERTIYTEVSTVNGEKSSKIVENTVTKQPVNKVVALGTKEDVAPQPVVVEPTQPETPKPEETKPTPQPETPKSEETKPTPQPETPKPEETKPTPQPDAPKPEETKPEEKVDKTALKTQIDRALALVPTDYSTTSYDTLKPILAAAQNVYVSDSVKQPEIDSETTKLKDTIDALNVDKTKLQEQITVANQKQEADYSPKTWNDFKQAEIKAKEINNQTIPLPKQSEIDAATKALQDAIKALAVDKTALQDAINRANSKRKEKYTTQTWKSLEDTLTAAKSVNADDATTQSKVNAATEKLEEAIKNLAPLAKKPILKFVDTDKKVLDHEVIAKYSLENPTKAKIKSITATLKKDGQVVKTVNLTENNLDALLDNVEYFKGYTLSTTMVYDKGNGEETEILADQPIQLDLKKVEIKNIKETSLISVDDAGVETDISLLSEKPTDISSYYLKVTTHDNKVTRLSVDKIEEVEKDGKTLFKVTATAPDLIQRNGENKISETYTHYFEKQKAHEDDVYYSFNDLVAAMKANPSGTFKLGADLNAANVPTPNKQYVPGKFSGTLTSVDGKQYTIHNMARQLFDNLEGGTVKNINLGNVNINMPWIENISALSRVAKNATVENVKVTGNILGKDGIAGIVNKVDVGGLLQNVAFVGNLTGVGDKGWDMGGISGEVWKGNIKKAYVDANIVANKARIGGLVARTDNGYDANGVNKYAFTSQSVVKGTIKVKTPVEVGGFISKNYPWGRVLDTVTMMKVENGEEFYGSKDLVDDDGYFTNNWIDRNYVVTGVSEGKRSFKYSRSKRIQEISLEEANKKIESFGITADKFEIAPLVEDRLNQVKPKSDTYKDTQDYDASRELAYRNIEKLQPFYNKEWIVNQGNKIPEGSKLLTTEVLSVTGMKDGQFVTDLSDADHIMIHYADKTKEIKAITQKESKVQQVREYSIEGLGDIVYTPNMVVKDRTQLLSNIKAKLASVELDSDEVRKINNNPKMLYMEESFKEVKDNLDALVKALVENEDHQLNTDEAAQRALIKKVEDNKAKIMLALAYLNQYYGIKYNGLNIKNMMTFKPDFYGKNVNVLDRLISFASNGNNLKGDQSHDAFNRALASATAKANLHEFLKYNMELFTSETDMNTWFKNNIADNAYVVEKQSSNPDFANKKHKLYEVINNGHHGRYILPLLNLKKAHMILITTYNTIAFSSFEKYGKNTAEEREAFKKQVDLRAQEQINYLDFWSRLAADNVRNNLLKSENMVPSAIWDNHDVPGLGWVDRMGHTKKGDFAPIREFYGPTDKWHGYNGMGAYAYIFQNPQPQEAVYYIISSMISDFGTSAFTHETTHINDRMAYLGTWRHREGTDVEAFAQGMLQSPSVSNPNGEYGALGLNMAYERQNDGNQIYNYNPNVLNSREKIDHYMKNYNESMMMLDYLEAESVIKKNTGTNDKWFKKIDKKYREKADRNGLVGEPHQWDLVRDLNDDEKNTKLTSIDQLVDGNFATKHGLPGNGHYRTEGFDSAYTVVNMMTGIYGGNTSKSAVGSISFKHNTFRMWGYFGYLDGFLGYASNKYKQESKAAGNVGLGDDFIINKVSNGKFQSLEAWKKAWYHEVHEKAQRGFVEIEIDGQKISTYAQLQTLFDAAVEKDLQGNDFKNTVDLKWKVYKQLLQKSDGFAGDLFTKA